MTLIAMLGVVLAFPFSLQAQTFQPREGCTHLVTIQSEGCYVRHVVTCPEMANSGPLVYATGKDGVLIATAFDDDGATMFTGSQSNGMLIEDRTDLVSLSALTATGTDSYDYTMAGENGVKVRFSGITTLTGEAVTIDGRSLQVLQTRQSFMPAGGAAVESDITSLYDAEFALVLTAESRDAITGEVVVQRRPVDFLFPGEADALSTVPQFGCDG